MAELWVAGDGVLVVDEGAIPAKETNVEVVVAYDGDEVLAKVQKGGVV